MEFTDEQKQAIADWAAEGESLSNIQKRIKSEFDITMTYMDVRFLMLDLDVSVKDKETPKPLVPPEPDPMPAPMPEPMPEAGPGDLPSDPAAMAPAPEGLPQVTVEIDKIVAPGAVVSGSAVFSDGVSARWSIDQMGRLGLSGVDESYQPSEADIQAFQVEVQKTLQARGF